MTEAEPGETVPRIDRRAAPSPDGAMDFGLLINSITDYAIYMLDSEGRVASWNAGARRFKGYADAEIIGRDFACFYTDEDRRAGVPAAALADAVRDGRYEGEGWRLRKDGSRFWAHAVIAPIYKGSGVLHGYAKVTRDLTERNATIDALRRSEAQFSLLVNGLKHSAMFMLDLNGDVTFWNRGAERITGYTEAEIIGRNFAVFYTGEDRAAGEPQRTLDMALSCGKFEREAWRVRKDGSRYWASIAVDPVRDGAGNVVGFAKVTLDATEALEARLALGQAREALFQSQKMEAIGRLAAGVAHDFNNILQGIIGGLDMVLDLMPEDTPAHKFTNLAINAAMRGCSLTHSLLSYTRKQILLPQKIAVPPFLAEMQALLARTIGPQIEIEVKGDRTASVIADPGQLQTALLNLAINAAHAMPDGGILTLTAREETVGDESLVVIGVTDTGIGMDEETLRRASEPFFTTKGHEGTGLGLSMVQGFAEQSGGTLNIMSARGVGTVVQLRLPSAATVNLLDWIKSGTDKGPKRALIRGTEGDQVVDAAM